MISGIDQSLNILKQLENKLKNQHQRHTTTVNYKTQQDQDVFPTKKKNWGSRLITEYQQSEGKLQHENKYLKRYVNKLLKMNDYLKNQLVKNDRYSSHSFQPMKNPEMDLLKIQIQYLQELNREKELQLIMLQKNPKKHTRYESSIQPFSMESAKKKSFSSRNKMTPKTTSSINRNPIKQKTTVKKQQVNKTLKKPHQHSAANRCSLCYS